MVYNVVAFVYPKYETLDLHGPLEMLGRMDDVKITILAQTPEVASYQGQRILADICNPELNEVYECDCFIMPGGTTENKEILKNEILAEFIRKQDKVSKTMFSVCTGAAIFAKAGILDNKMATTNKRAFHHIKELFPKVLWQCKARWVQTEKYLSSSGVSAGTDAALFHIKTVFGEENAKRIAKNTEYSWNEDPHDDPFSVCDE